MSHRTFHRFLFALVFIAASAGWTSANAQFSNKPALATSSVVSTPQVRAELVAHAPEGLTPGQTVWVGLWLTHQRDWHTYWKNPGDSGLPTELTWELPPGLDMGETAWPVPRLFRIGKLANYGYDGQVLLAAPMQVPASFKPPPGGMGQIDIRLRATWLACRVECIPEEGSFVLQLPVRSSTAMHSALFAQAQGAQPQPLQGQSHITVEGERLQLRVTGLPASVHGQPLEVFAETPAVLVPAAVPGQDWTQVWQGDTWTASLPLSPERGASPVQLPLVLAPEGRSAGDAPQGWHTVAAVEGQWSRAAPLTGVSPALAAALAANQNTPQPPAASGGALLTALLGGLIGGLLLNLMPCVFPVLAIKVMGFARHGNHQRAQRLGGVAYTAGVVLSFMALGGLLLALRAAGEQLGWGFQLQSPTVVAVLALLFTLIGLNLAGVFEFGQFVPGRLATLQARHPAGDAFLTGVLAVAIASPCTAPFMGAALGFAIDMPAPQALAVFAALGVGMALPYLLAAWVPAVVGWLPRPGAWMDTFRRAMAFPMFATVVWLVWVLGQQSGIDGAGALLALLVAGSSVVWALTLRGRTRIVIASVLIAFSAWLAGTIGPNVLQPMEAPAPVAGVGSAPGALWQPWSAQRVQELTAQGKPVFVDFTAAWCVTCQYNKRNALQDAGVLADFDKRGVTLLRADWTRRDSAITTALAQLGRNGVPVYVLLAPGRAPVVMSEILSVSELRAALALL
ncbi:MULTISPECIES: protein-disulfide reductase DsbD [unclassified Simplicispira]|uniref:protein-disulfide reductase DsbD family protein n=1 Tax=unclassified Simplicispira TaxID=2630407 RepID=UPI000D5DB8B1|nr:MULTISPECIES: thioredoxin family protein [unclassified Simplicispira]PVY57010.1 thiol:disulfide interchange protein DsbD [Simplicispira sp. 125]REG17955.1 thiol:disulfide interchange protein DsbD [Simplicispira sp. 110]